VKKEGAFVLGDCLLFYLTRFFSVVNTFLPVSLLYGRSLKEKKPCASDALRTLLTSL